jgi:hypothetical protein
MQWTMGTTIYLRIFVIRKEQDGQTLKKNIFPSEIHIIQSHNFAHNLHWKATQNSFLVTLMCY